MMKKLFILAITLLASISISSKSLYADEAYYATVVSDDSINDDVVVYDGNDYWLIHYKYGCYSFYEGQQIVLYEDGYSLDSYGSKIIVDDNQSCDIDEANEITEKAYINELFDSEDKAIITDEKNNQYLIEYGVGCLSIWRYEEKIIYIDRGGSFIDGIGDTIYLPDGDGDCRIWDATEFGQNNSFNTNSTSYYPDTSPTITNCPDNSSYDNGKCYCNTGYEPKDNKCIKTCPDLINGHLGEDNECYCNQDYSWNTKIEKCVQEKAKSGYSQTCASSYFWWSNNSNKCVSREDWCKEKSNQWTYSSGVKECVCISGYNFLSDGLTCVNQSKEKENKRLETSDNIEQTIAINENECTKNQVVGDNFKFDINKVEYCCYEGYELKSTGITPSGPSYKCTPLAKTVNADKHKDDNENYFNDIGITHPQANAVKYLKKNKIINGYSDGSFKPNNPVNRAELLKILIGSDLPNSTYENCFKDVKQEWFAPYVCYAKSKGWINGYSDNTFKPAQVVNRAEAIKMAMEVFDMSVNDNLEENPYQDVPSDLWFAKYVKAAQDKGLFNQINKYNPDQGMQRGDISEIIYRLLAIKKLEVDRYESSLDVKMNN